MIVTDFLGPFVLTHHLLKVLKRAVHSRIINVSSEAHRIANAYDLKAITKCQSEFRSHFKAYSVTKLALLLFTHELSKKLASKYFLHYYIKDFLNPNLYYIYQFLTVS